MESIRATELTVEEELHVCPSCGYKQGFHVAFVRVAPGEEKSLRLELICPSCSARFNLNHIV